MRTPIHQIENQTMMMCSCAMSMMTMNMAILRARLNI